MRVVLLFLLLFGVGFAKNLALVIGNSNYAKGYLSNPINDAKLIRDILEDELNFKVTYKTDLTKYQMEEAIRDFAAAIGRDDIALFYYAGHGMQYNRLNYLIPLKAKAVTEGQIPSVGVDVNYVLGGMERAKLAIVLLDACRNNPFSRSFSRGGTRGLAQASSNQQNYIISYATEAGAETQDGKGDNSPYALALKAFLPKPLEVSTLLKKVKNQVASTTSPRQVPYVDDRYIGEYWLRQGGGSCTKVVQTSARYKTVTEKVLDREGGERKVVIPAKYKRVYEKVLVCPSYRMYRWTEDGVEKTLKPSLVTKTIKILASEPSEKIIITENDEAKNILIPATYRTVTIEKIEKDVDIKEIPKHVSYKAISVPAQYKKVSRTIVAVPASVRRVTVPPTYKTVTKKVLVTPAGEKTIVVPCGEGE